MGSARYQRPCWSFLFWCSQMWWFVPTIPLASPQHPVRIEGTPLQHSLLVKYQGLEVELTLWPSPRGAIFRMDPVSKVSGSSCIFVSGMDAHRPQ